MAASYTLLLGMKTLKKTLEASVKQFYFITFNVFVCPYRNQPSALSFIFLNSLTRNYWVYFIHCDVLRLYET